MTFPTISRASTKGTPDIISVDIVIENFAAAFFTEKLRNIGIFKATRLVNCLPGSVFLTQIIKVSSKISPIAIAIKLLVIKSLSPITILVSIGRSSPILSKVCWKFGITVVIKTIITPTATTKTTIG